MTEGNGEVLRFRVGAAEKEIEDLNSQTSEFAQRLARVEGRLDDVVTWLKIQTTVIGSLVVAVLSAVLGYLLVRGGH